MLKAIIGSLHRNRPWRGPKLRHTCASSGQSAPRDASQFVWAEFGVTPKAQKMSGDCLAIIDRFSGVTRKAPS